MYVEFISPALKLRITTASCIQHRGVLNADAQKKKSVVILRRHHGEVLVKVGGNLEWIDEEDVDTTSIVENLPREQSTSLPIISSVQEWVQSPWSLQQ